MDDSSKKIVMIIAAATLGTIAVMAFRNYSKPVVEKAQTAKASAPASAKITPVENPSPTPSPSPSPVNDDPTTEDIPAIDGTPSMIFESHDGIQNGQVNKDAPAPANTIP